MLGLVVVVYVIASRATSVAEWDRWLDLGFAIVLFGVMWVWVRANRTALAKHSHRASQRRTLIVRVVLSPRLETSPRTLVEVSSRRGITDGQPRQQKQREEIVLCLAKSDRR